MEDIDLNITTQVLVDLAIVLSVVASALLWMVKSKASKRDLETCKKDFTDSLTDMASKAELKSLEHVVKELGVAQVERERSQKQLLDEYKEQNRHLSQRLDELIDLQIAANRRQ